MTGLEEDQEFDFDFLFEFNQSDEGAGVAPEHYSYVSSNISPGLSLPTAHPSLPVQCHDMQMSAPGLSAMAAAGHPSGYGAAVDGGPSGYFLSSGHVRPNGAPALESPRIEITSYLGLHHNNNQFFHDVEVEDVLPSSKRPPSTATLSLPNLEAYRDPSCLSPASSLSSRSCNSEASSYESNYSYPYASPQTSPWQSPCVSPKTTDPEEGFPRGLGACSLLGSPRHSPSTSPRTSVTEESWLGARTSRPSSPSNKRKYGLNGRQLSCSPHHSPTPSPHSSPRVSVTDDTWLGNTTQYTSSAIVAAINALSTDSSLDLGDGVPIKARKTALDHSPSVALKVEPAGEDLGTTPPASDFPPEEFPPFQHIRKGAFCDQYLSVPQHPYPWARPRSPTSYTSPSLPALDWQLPSHSGPYELRIEVQPKSHHRAHYETEGSRGAVKASAGGHPSVQLHGYLESEPLTLQLFIGTADDRLLRPHAFYQVHRITGKTVSTTSHEAVLSNTKVLEIPLLPENNMRAIIDCAGILKLRNSDIELRKGETDIGRKNTRVRLVFRVHIPQPSGRTLSLQVASNPIECSQRSAQELPLVEKQSVASCPVLGGKRMVLSGHNFLQDSKVIFVEKAPDGHHIWEMEAKTDRDLCKPNSLVVEIPPFRNQRITSPVQVSFYVCNGKRKRSQYQPFTYLPANVPTIKTEPTDDYEPALTCGPMSQGLSPLPKPCFSQQLALPPDPGSCLVAGFPPCLQRSAVMSPPPSTSPTLHDLSSAPYSKGMASPGHGPLGLQRPAAGALAGPEMPRPVGMHPGSPQPPPPALLQPQVSPQPSSSRPPGGQPALCPHSPSTALPSGTQEPTCLQSCSPTRPPGMGHQQHQLPKVPETEPAAARPPPLPEVREDSNQGLAPTPVSVKREPQELDQLYLDDVNEIIRNDLSSTSTHS
ncbi:nuclear factor of activated T-cells, cytoplasmic 1 isoform X1 [Pipistrellus kuhlii]|uniref:Nuclear factor of activated T-cells, cytoplasmic 1 n=2 Tax=Pipistrellus kuhlii TaxID=59472 RepID=A0A7J7YAN7_PIPKU|nr:nuclear factor of activated T-cells, cytoplasmic 1 isoform X1 [Pipistrellus kuhlii]KAF6358696.1 nuclear factor of activated T cells 1 [Pipistrellus kuhlii]